MSDKPQWGPEPDPVEELMGHAIRLYLLDGAGVAQVRGGVGRWTAYIKGDGLFTWIGMGDIYTSMESAQMAAEQRWSTIHGSVDPWGGDA